MIILLHCVSRSDCGELNDPTGANTPPTPTLRRSARLLSKQQNLLKKDSLLSPLSTTTATSSNSGSGIQQQFSIRSSRSRLQSTSSVASSPASSVLGESTSPEITLPRKGRQRLLSYSPEQCSKKIRRTSERGRRKEEASSGETSTTKERHLESVDGEKYCDTSPLRQESHQRNSSSVKSPERKVTGRKRTRSSNSDNHSPPTKRKKTSSGCESKKNTASSGSRKRSRRKVDPQENIDSGSSGPETSSKRAKPPKSKAASAEVVAKSTSSKNVQAVKRKSRSRVKVKKGEEAAISDSDSSPIRTTTTTTSTRKRKAQGRGKSKLQHSDTTKPVPKEQQQTQPPQKDTTEGITCIPTNHFYSLPPFPEFARLASMASEG